MKTNRKDHSKNRIKVIIPAAGFASRMGYPEAKEILINPATGKEFISFSLEQALLLEADVVVITRAEKQSLVQWLKTYSESYPYSLEIIYTETTKEWPETVLKSKELWGDFNFLLLPDTDWSPKQCLKQSLNKVLEMNLEVVYYGFTDENLNWGFVNIKKDQQGFKLCEKPQHKINEYTPWGVIGYKKSIGVELFEKHLESTFDHEVKELAHPSFLFMLDSFYDRTRSK